MSTEPLKYKVMDEESKLKTHGMDSQRIESFVLVGENKWFCPKAYVRQSEAFRKFKSRPSDVWIRSLPRSGTTWTQEMVWLVVNNLDYETALKYNLDSRFPFFDSTLLYLHPLFEEYCNMSESVAEKVKLATKEGKFSPEIIAAYPSPRFIKTHLPFCLLPEDLFNSGCKIIYVARNPKDVAVSSYHFHKSMTNNFEFKGDFKDFWNLFKKNLVMYAPYWEHVKEAWARRNDPNFLFMFYEDMYNDLPKVIQKVAKFFEKSYNSEEIAKLADHLNVKNFKKNKAVNQHDGLEATIFKPNSFIRQGKAGGWKSDFTPELEEEANEWIKENLKDTDLRFPIQM